MWEVKRWWGLNRNDLFTSELASSFAWKRNNGGRGGAHCIRRRKRSNQLQHSASSLTMTPSLNPGKREQWLVSYPIPSFLISVLFELFALPPFLPQLSPLCQSVGSRRKKTSHSCLGSHPLSFLLPKSIFSVPIPLMAGRSSSSTLTFILQHMKRGSGSCLFSHAGDEMAYLHSAPLKQSHSNTHTHTQAIPSSAHTFMAYCHFWPPLNICLSALFVCFLVF